jgi:uncharacterized protein YhaN
MRIRRLDMICYGRFTDVSVDLPSHDRDIHLIFGPNEAGKSTTQAAIEDLLFGIPQMSGYAFVHDYSAMRIGAIIDCGKDSVEVLRRKGLKNTLLGPDGAPYPEGESVLTGCLAGANRLFFERMFSLSQERLRKGGQEILEARDEVGQMLFSAGSGITGLRHKLRSLEEEAEGLWGPRRAAHRKYYQIHDRLMAADNAIRQHTVSVKKWKELKSALENARQTCDTLEQKIAEKTVELRKLSRIRRVYRNVRTRAQLEKTMDELGEVVPLPEDAHRILTEAEKKEAAANLLLDNFNEQLAKAREERDALLGNEALLLRQEDIRALGERRITVRDGKTVLPKHRAELVAAESELRRLAQENEWGEGDTEQLLACIPARAKVNVVRDLLTRRGELLASVRSAEAALKESEEKIGDLEEQLDSRGTPADVSRITAAIETVKERADIASQISVTERTLQDLRAEVAQCMGMLRPAVDDEQTLVTMPLPPRETIQAYRDSRRDLETRKKSCARNIRTVEQRINRQQKAHDRIVRSEEAVSPRDLSLARERRDTGWLLIRRRYIEKTDLTKDEILGFAGEDTALVDAYESSVREADQRADRRFEKAEAAARLTGLVEEIAEQKDLLETMRLEQETMDDEEEEMAAAWKEMWNGARFEPLSPDAMLDWMRARDDIAGRSEQRDEAERRYIALQEQASSDKALLLDALDEVDGDARRLRDDPLRLVIEAAAVLKQRHEKNIETIAQLTADLRKAQREGTRKIAGLDRARKDWSHWEDQWKETLDRMNLAPGATPEVITVQIDGIDRMREIAVQIGHLRQDRIAKIERDNDAFDADVTKSLKVVAPDLSSVDAEEAVLELERRLKEAERVRDLQEQKDEAISELERRIKDGEASRRSARGALNHLMNAAGVECIEALKDAIDGSDSLRKLKADLTAVSDLLSEEGDGLTISELDDECRGVDIDQVAAHEQALDRELKELQSRLLETKGDFNSARAAFEAVGGEDLTARATAFRQSALTEMQEIAERYVRVHTSALLLKWAIDRFRIEKQAPLLRRAGQLFSMLTNGSFLELSVEFDEKDNTYLAGVRPDGSIVRTDGMSTGTADQLYLALRIASVEEFIDRSAPLPFIADDLFIHFDDDRAAAGLKVLEALSRKTQVLFFTHHRHLIDVAAKALDKAPSMVFLDKMVL